METRKPRTRPRKAERDLSIRLLGEIRVQQTGAAIPLPASKRTRALLGYLVATAAPHSRQALCDLLWDGPDDPRASLRWSLTKLRPQLNEDGFDHLTADREHVTFVSGDAQIDVQILGRLLRGDPQAAGLDDLEKAAALLQGEFLDGLDLPSCYRFHHWCLAERERWDALRRQVLSILVERLADNPERALPYVRAMVAADPLSENSHSRLVKLLATLGRRKDADAHYQYARGMLRRELAAPLLGELKPPAPQHGQPPSSSARTGPDGRDSNMPPPKITGLIGRFAERQIGTASIDALLQSKAPGALLFLGEPGIGKSRLLDFVAGEAARKGARVIAARCFEAEAVRPYGSWIDALGSIIEDVTDPAAQRLLSPFGEDGDLPADDGGGRTRLFATVADLISAEAVRCPIVLIFDDLQWIDEGSSSLLHYVLRATRMVGRVLFIGAARADEIEDNPWCKRTVSALAHDGALQRVQLPPLSEEEAAQFFSAKASEDEVRTAVRESGGNPLFLVELANAGRPAAGRDLEAMIADRIGRLDAPERDLIVFASATARDFKPELLGAAMDLPELQLIERIDRLERRGLLKPGTEGRFDFSHDLIRQTTYRSLSQPHRRLIHRQIARALGSAARRDQTLAGELVYHAGAAGDHMLAVEASIAAGEHCLRLFANAAAVDAADRGLGHLAQLGLGADRAHAQIALLKVKVFAGTSPGLRPKPELLGEIRRAVETAEFMGLRDDAVLGWHMISWWTQRSNDTLAAQQAILRAEEISRRTDELMRCQQLANTGRCLLEVEGDVRLARNFVDEAGRLAAALDQSLVEVEWGRALLSRWDGDVAAAGELMRRAVALAHLYEDRWREIECLVWVAKLAIESSTHQETLAVCGEIDRVAAQSGDGPAPVATALRALSGLLKGGDAGEVKLGPALAALRSFDDKALLSYVLNQTAECHLAHSRLGPARLAASEALAMAQIVKRTTEIVVAKSILVRIAVQEGETIPDLSSFQPMTESADAPQWSSRARTAFKQAQDFLVIPTPVQTGTG
ncbi:AAA family ATPase (plasmid) [Mesorhizobium sp. AR07]|uniref:ATP-binding protein n=1 Tax=Mesorhizobium sp. AR07 TaxID=2865838 RepID=UPI0021605F75|nr:AAA family ATPase [Mesorhizobium sp. AR07]UVK49442.1 AAA family ATPase [Mesorhizobium sp. AR07]